MSQTSESVRARAADGTTVTLPGSPDDYAITVVFAGDDWTTTVTEIRSVSDDVPAYSANLTGLDEVVFEGAIDNAVTIIDGELPLEMIYLAEAAYAAEPDAGLFHDAWPLAYEDPDGVAELVALATDAAIARGWHAVEAAELGMKPADYGEYGDLKYSFAGGLYQAIETDDTLDGDPSEADALIFTGVVDGKKTLTVVFTGTDQLSDTADYGDFDDHYAKFAPLVDAIAAYVDDAGVGIEQVLVSGHSLGAAMVQYFMDDFKDDDRFRAWTVGSPGADDETQVADDPRTTNYVEWDDPVTWVPFLSNPAVRALFADLVDEEFSDYPELATIIDALLDSPLTKYRNGTDVTVDDGLAVPHLISGYIEAVTAYLDGGGDAAGQRLVVDNDEGGHSIFVVDAAGLDGYRGTAGVDHLSYAGSDDLVLPAAVETIRAAGHADIAIAGNGLDNTITANAGDNVVGGRAGDDVATGGRGADTISGNAGDDRLRGGDGADVLRGGRGADVLHGGEGRDMLTGGAGADVVAVADAGQSRPGAADRVTDFSRADGDRIDLTKLGLTDDFAFVGRQAFSGAAGEVRYTLHHGDSTVLADLDGDGAADLAIRLDDVARLKAGDFLV